MSDIEFVDGLIFKLPHEKAPEFVKGALSIKREEMIAFLSGKTDEWINVDLKVSKAGKAYACINSWKPENQNQEQAPQAAPDGNDDFSDIPF